MMDYRSWSELSNETRDRMTQAVRRCQRSCNCLHVWDADCANEQLKQQHTNGPSNDER